jgi:hypothetical protein
MVDFIEPTVNALLSRAEQSLNGLEKKAASLKAKVCFPLLDKSCLTFMIDSIPADRQRPESTQTPRCNDGSAEIGCSPNEFVGEAEGEIRGTGQSFGRGYYASSECPLTRFVPICLI